MFIDQGFWLFYVYICFYSVHLLVSYLRTAHILLPLQLLLVNVLWSRFLVVVCIYMSLFSAPISLIPEDCPYPAASPTPSSAYPVPSSSPHPVSSLLLPASCPAQSTAGSDAPLRCWPGSSPSLFGSWKESKEQMESFKCNSCHSSDKYPYVVDSCFIPQQEPYQSLKRVVWPVWYAWPYQTVDVMDVFAIF